MLQTIRTRGTRLTFSRLLPRIGLMSCMLLALLLNCPQALIAQSVENEKAAEHGSPAASLAGKPLRIVTFNAEILTAPRIRAGTINRFRFDTARRDHLERVAAIIETLNPDIFNLIEVTSVEAVDQLVAILHQKGMKEYQGYHVESKDTFTGMDVAVITKITPDLVEGKRIRLIHDTTDGPKWRKTFSFEGRDGEQRSATASLDRHALYYISLGKWKLGFLGLHLKSNPRDNYSNARRTVESQLCQQIVQQEIVARGYQPIVLGDLNDYDPDVPDRDTTRSTRTKVLRDLKAYDPSSPGPELINVASYIVRQADRYTSHWDRNENLATDSDDVFTMLDHVLVPRQWMSYIDRVFISHAVDLSTSDHRPVVLDLKLPSQP